MPLYIAQSGDLDRCHACLTDRRTDGQTLKDRATQLLIKYKSGALVTQFIRAVKADNMILPNKDGQMDKDRRNPWPFHPLCLPRLSHP